MNFEYILTELKENTLFITINNPTSLNALNSFTISEIKRAFETAAYEKEVKGIIITGSGDKAFVAGADIKEFADFSPEEGRALSSSGHDIFNFIENFGKPVIAAVNGFALGGGCELAMACHLRVASENAKFGQPEVNLGIIPGYGGTQRLIQLIGKGKAFEFLMTGDMIKSEDAHKLGLVNYVVPQVELIAKCQEILNKIYAKSPLAIRQIIRSVGAYYDKNTNGFEFEINAFSECFETTDFKEGTTAFMEKRKPVFN